jgi:hypothetical protein
MIESREDIIRRFAYQFYLLRVRCHLPLNEKEDWEDGIRAYESYVRLFKL